MHFFPYHKTCRSNNMALIFSLASKENSKIYTSWQQSINSSCAKALCNLRLPRSIKSLNPQIFLQLQFCEKLKKCIYLYVEKNRQRGCCWQEEQNLLDLDCKRVNCRNVVFMVSYQSSINSRDAIHSGNGFKWDG